MPLAFFCTLFFRHRKKSVSAPWDGKSQFAPESARQAPPKGNFLGRGFSLRSKQGAFRSPPCTPFGSPTEAIERPIWLQALLPRRSRRVKPHQRGISSAKLSLIDASRELSARPPAPLRIATRSNRAPHRAASPALAPESARQAPPKGNFFGKVVSYHASRGLSARPLHPFRKVGVPMG